MTGGSAAHTARPGTATIEVAGCSPGARKSPSQPPELGGRGGLTHTQKCKIQKRHPTGGLAPGQREIYLHGGFDLNRLAVQQIRLVLPLLHCFNGGRSQHPGSPCQPQIFQFTPLSGFPPPDPPCPNPFPSG